MKRFIYFWREYSFKVAWLTVTNRATVEIKGENKSVKL